MDQDNGLLILKLLDELQSDQFIKSMVFILDFWTRNTDDNDINNTKKPIEKFIRIYNTEGPFYTY